MALGKNIKIDKLIPESKKKPELKKEVNKITTSDSDHKVKVVKKELEKKVQQFQGVSLTVEPSRRKKVKKATLIIEGEIDILKAEFLTEKIKEAITTFDIIDVKFKNVEALDLSAVQIMYYFSAIYNSGGKSISFQIENLPMSLKTLLVKTKYNKILFKKPIISAK